MPHIVIISYKEERLITEMKVHVRLTFKKEFYRTAGAYEKLEQIQKEFEQVVQKYFELKYASESCMENTFYSDLDSLLKISGYGRKH